MSEPTVTCGGFDELFSTYLEDSLDAETRIAVDRHVASCSRCTALLAGVMAVSREAGALRPLEPSRDLLSGIEARIEAPVVAIEARPMRARHERSPWWLGAAAAALVVSTASITYLFTKNDEQPRSGAMVASIPGPSLSERADSSVGPEPDAGPLVVEPLPTRQPVPRSATRDPVTTPPASVRAVSSGVDAAAYDREIAQLRRIVQERRSELNPATLEILLRNIALIDNAIAESRAALRRDPGSEFLSEQLTRALDKKVEILRTAARLPVQS